MGRPACPIIVTYIIAHPSDGLDVNVTSNVTWFHLNHDMVSRRIYKLSFYGGHSITLLSMFHV